MNFEFLDIGMPLLQTHYTEVIVVFFFSFYINPYLYKRINVIFIIGMEL